MDNRRVGIKTLKVAFLAVVLSLAARTASAGPLSIALGEDLLTADKITAFFNGSTGKFTATGTTFGSGLTFNLTAYFSGGLPTSATLLIGSESSPFVSASGLASNGFGFNSSPGGTIEFLFTSVSGTSVGGPSPVFSSSAPLDVQITVTPGFTPRFTGATWINSQDSAVLRQAAPTDTVPEPSTLLALVAGAGGLLLRRRRAARTIA